MRVPLSWLCSFTPARIEVPALMERLTMAGLEVDGLVEIGAFHPLVVAGAVVSSEPAGDLSRLVVDAGRHGGAVQVLSGAPNAGALAPGAVLAIALPGATILSPSLDEFELIEVQPTRIRGMESNAVACSARELGIGDDHSGLYGLPAGATPGRPLYELLQPAAGWEADRVLDIAILPNFARCLSMIGMAREVAALTSSTPHLDVDLSPAAIERGPVDATIEAADACVRFSSARIAGVRIKKSPRWMQRRLILAGVPVINNVVDAVNYAMLEIGQPMHAYDAAKLADLRLVVRRSRAGERLHVLTQADEQAPLELPEGTVVIASTHGPVAVAGVVGGTATAIGPDTQEILLESASFEWSTVRRSQAALKIFTESSARFSRGVDPTITRTGIRRVIRLLEETCPDLRVIETGDAVVHEPTPAEIDLDLASLEATLGASYTLDEVRLSLEAVGIGVRVLEGGRGVRAIVPPSRADVTAAPDLMEEVARLVGYDRLPETMPCEPLPLHAADHPLELRERARDAMVRRGLQEVITYTLSSPEVEAKIAITSPAPEPLYVRVMNPISAHRTVMRRTLLAGLLETIQQNRRHTTGVQLFELGVVALPERSAPGEKLPAERQRLAFAMAGLCEESSVHGGADRDADFFDGASVAESLLGALHVKDVEIAADDVAPYQPGLSAKMARGDRVYGHLGVIHPSVAATFDIDGWRIVAGEMDLDALIADASTTFRAVHPPRFPSITIDISMFVEKRISGAEIVRTVQSAGSPLLRGVSIIDAFTGAQVPAGRRSIAVRMDLNAMDRSLTMPEAQDARALVVQKLRESLDATIRE